MLNRGDLTNLILVDVRELVSAADATDDQDAIKLARAIESALPYLRTASYLELGDLVISGAHLARSMWSDAELDDSLAELFAAEKDILTERRHLAAQRAEGLKQLPLFRQRRPPEE